MEMFEVGSIVVLHDGSYELEKLLGTGSYGHVYLAHSRKDNMHVAIKILLSTVKEEIEIQKEEALILEKLDHPNIITLITHGYCGQHYVFVLEYFEGMDLYSYITVSYNNLGDFDEQKQFSEKLGLIKQIIRAVDYLHSNSIYHRDLKPENILINDDKIKLIDFGLSNTQLMTTETECGSYNYMSYENQFLHEYNNQKNDMWSLATIFVNLVYYKHPFERNQDIVDLDHQYFIDKLGCSYQVARLLKDKLYCPEYQRINAKELNRELNKLFRKEESAYMSPKSIDLEMFNGNWADDLDVSIQLSNPCSKASNRSSTMPIINGVFDEGF